MTVRVDSEAVAALRERAEAAVGVAYAVSVDEPRSALVVARLLGDPPPVVLHPLVADALFIAAASPDFVAALIADWERRGQALADLLDEIEELQPVTVYDEDDGEQFEAADYIELQLIAKAARSVLTGEPHEGETP